MSITIIWNKIKCNTGGKTITHKNNLAKTKREKKSLLH